MSNNNSNSNLKVGETSFALNGMPVMQRISEEWLLRREILRVADAALDAALDNINATEEDQWMACLNKTGDMKMEPFNSLVAIYIADEACRLVPVTTGIGQVTHRVKTRCNVNIDMLVANVLARYYKAVPSAAR